jgi:beta-galactosidase
MKGYLMQNQSSRIGYRFIVILAVSLLAGCASRHVKPLAIDLTAPAPQIITGHLGLGTLNAPDGQTFDADSQCLYRNGKPIIPVMGEFHYSRYPKDEWRNELLKMKAGGINVVATYVFWIHHEEEQGKFDWTGQRSLRDFLLLCKELDLYAVVRMGPWCHGEARNGGFPDWVQNAPFWANQKSFKSRKADPEFMKLVEPLYKEIAAQTQGLLWKDGGPVIGVQHDNECPNIPYLLTLKQLARDNGIDVPFYTMTGWNRVPIPKEGLLPLFGAYADGFWSDKKLNFRKAFFFSPIRDDGDMGALDGRITNVNPERNVKIERFPYVCCEIGGGMPSSYDNRIYVSPEDTATIALVRLGNGNNMPGYYMYHGGINPEGKLTTLNENKATGYPNDMPVKDYDFGAPLGNCGQVRESYHLLRQQHLFVKDFGDKLAPMHSIFPAEQPATFDDVNTARWCARTDGQSGFIFFNNHQRYLPLPAKENVQFAVKTKDGPLQVPQNPITLPADSFGILPFNIDFGGIRVKYATAQPICSLEADGQQWFFFTAIKGIKPEFVIGTKTIKNIRPGTGIAFTRKAPDGKPVNFIVLTPKQGKQIWKMSIAGRERIILSENVILPQQDGTFQIETLGNSAVQIALFPQCSLDSNKGTTDGIFKRFTISPARQAPQIVMCKQEKQAVIANKPTNPMDEESWKDAAVWQIALPKDISKDSLLRIHYTGDVARIYADGKLIIDNFYNGRPFDVALWRLNEKQLNSLELRMMPLRFDTKVNMTTDIRPDFAKAAFYAEISKVELIERTRQSLKISSN